MKVEVCSFHYASDIASFGIARLLVLIRQTCAWLFKLILFSKVFVACCT